ncbi:MAG: hypothetical protein F7C32_03380 [Desulfurococcales archaeon]|nr:hypothetical protein [Desulfurococcales archaeon]
MNRRKVIYTGRDRVLLAKMSYHLIELLETIQSIDGIPSITSIAEELNTHISTIWRRLKVLRSNYDIFTIDVNYAGIGARHLSILTDIDLGPHPQDDWPVEHYISLLPKGALYILLTRDLRLEETLDSITRTLENLGTDYSLRIYTTAYRGGVSLREYYDLTSRAMNPRWERVVEAVKVASRVTPPTYRRVRTDLVDLAIIDVLSRDPFYSLRDVTSTLNQMGFQITYSRVRRHYINHVIGRSMIRGVKLRLDLIPPEEGMDLVFEVTTDPYVAHGLARTLSTHPYTRFTLVSDEGDALIRMVVPHEHVHGAMEVFDQLQRSGFIADWQVFFADRHRSIEYLIPLTSIL